MHKVIYTGLIFLAAIVAAWFAIKTRNVDYLYGSDQNVAKKEKTRYIDEKIKNPDGRERKSMVSQEQQEDVKEVFTEDNSKSTNERSGRLSGLEVLRLYQEELHNKKELALYELWKNEVSDWQWTKELESYYKKNFIDIGIEGSIQDILCKESLCRVELWFVSPKKASRLAKMPRRDGVEVFVDANIRDDKTIVVLYSSRSGSRLLKNIRDEM